MRFRRQQVQLFGNNSSTGGSVTVDATGRWSEQITLMGTGTRFITALDTDLAGNVGGTVLSTFALDHQIVAPIHQLNVVGTTGADHITISQSNILVDAGAETIRHADARRKFPAPFPQARRQCLLWIRPRRFCLRRRCPQKAS